MGKTARCIKIIQILSARDLVNTKELADVLEINPRNIKEYIKELEECGYKIYSITGKNGGYKLDKSETIPSLKLTVSEKEVLLEGTEFLRNTNYMNQKAFDEAIGKIFSSISTTEITPTNLIERYPLKMEKNELQKRYVILKDCVENQLRCKILYISGNDKEKEHTLEPYKLYAYNGSWFVLAYNVSIEKFGYYKLNRIEKIESTRSHFTRMKSYDEKDYLDEFGMIQNGDYYQISVELTDLYQVISERVYGKNQRIERIDEHKTILNCSMQNKDMIKTFILSFGSKAKVLSPDWLKEEIAKETKLINDYYGENDD